MNKNKIIITSVILILTAIAITNPYLIMQFPWDSSINFNRNIEPYLIIGIISIACYTTINTIFLSLGIKDTSKHKHKHKVSGRIIGIEYSSIRINNSPRFKVTVEYLGLTKAFDALDEAVQFHLEIGDEAIIYYEESNPKNSHIDLKNTISKKQSKNNNAIESNAKFKLIEINSTQNPSNYELIGELVMPDLPTRKVSLNQVIEDTNLSSFVPGMIIPCKIDGKGKDLSISMIIS